MLRHRRHIFRQSIPTRDFPNGASEARARKFSGAARARSPKIFRKLEKTLDSWYRGAIFRESFTISCRKFAGKKGLS
jgi:hypothetical protein